MMRKGFSIGLLATMAFVFGLAQSANAGVTIDVVFRDAPGATTFSVAAGDPGPGCTFTGYYAATVSTGYCMDVLLRTDNNYGFISMGASLSYDSDSGLAVDSMYEWIGFGVEFDKSGNPLKNCAPFGGLVDNGGILQAFDCSVAPPNNPPFAPAGTYQIGTIVWNTTGTTGPSTETIASVIAGGDGFGAVINGNIIDISGQVVVVSRILSIIPEPATASLLGLGLAGLILAGRRNRA